MRTIQRPGEYITGFPSGSGTDYTRFRCAVCWHEWFTPTEDNVDLLMGEDVIVVCPACCQSRSYVDACKGAKATSESQAVYPKVRKPRPKVDPPLFSGIDTGYDLRHKGHK